MGSGGCGVTTLKGRRVDPEKLFRALLKQEGIIYPITEYRFAPPRRWRFDYSWPAHSLALEVEGGIWIRGRHSRGAGMLKDMEKYNRAALNGWKVLRTTPDKLCSAETIVMIREALGILEEK